MTNQLLAVAALNGVDVVDRSYSSLLVGIEDVLKSAPSYGNVVPLYMPNMVGKVATADVVSLIGADIVDVNLDQVVLLGFRSGANGYYSAKGQVDNIAWMITETYSNFQNAGEHDVIVCAGSSFAAGSRVSTLDHRVMVTPLSGVNTASQYIIFNVQPALYGAEISNTTEGPLTLPLSNSPTKGQEGLVAPFPLKINDGATQGAFSWIAVVLKGLNLTDVTVTAIPIFGNSRLINTMNGILG